MREISPEVSPGSSLFQETDYYYDENRNLIRTETHQRKNGAIVQDSIRKTTYAYDILNVQISSTQAADTSSAVTTKFYYDRNRNQVLVQSPEAVAGNQPKNTVLTILDAEGKVFREVHGFDFGEAKSLFPNQTPDEQYFSLLAHHGGALDLGNPIQSTTQYNEYYENDSATGEKIRVEETVTGIEGGSGHKQTRRYNVATGLLEMEIDAMGSETRYCYDLWNHVVSVEVWGDFLSGDLANNSVTLSYLAYEYDDAGRQTTVTRYWFDPREDTPWYDWRPSAQGYYGEVVTKTEYADDSKVVKVTGPDGRATATSYDGAGRVVFTISPASTVTYRYNQFSQLTPSDSITLNNLLDVQTSERGDDNVERTVVTRTESDNLGRAVLTRQSYNISGKALESKSEYDSQGNLAKTTDPKGNTVTYVYDNLGRLTETHRPLTQDKTLEDETVIKVAIPYPAQSAVPPSHSAQAMEIITRQKYDANSRLIAQIDDRGNATRYAYDALNRRIATRMADGTLYLVGDSGIVTWTSDTADRPAAVDESKIGYDRWGNVTRTLDPNGTVTAFDYDLLGRLTHKRVPVTGLGVAPAQFCQLNNVVEYYVYNGLSQLLGYNTATSNLMRFYDSLGLLRQEFQVAGDFDEARTARRTTSSFQYDKSGARLSTESQSYLLDRTLPGEVIPVYEGDPTRKLRYEYNALGRLWMIFDELDTVSKAVAEYTYWGAGRVKSIWFKNNALSEFDYDGRSDQANDADDFGIGRVAGVRHFASWTHDPFDERTMEWDASGNKTERVVTMRGLAAGSWRAGRTFTYEYDSVNRLIQSQVLPAPPAAPAGSPSGTPPNPRRYFLDGAGNRLSHGDFDMSGHVELTDGQRAQTQGQTLARISDVDQLASWIARHPWWRRMDVTGDGRVDNTDATRIMQAAEDCAENCSGENCAADCKDWTRHKSLMPVDNPYVRREDGHAGLNQYSRAPSEIALDYDANGNLISARAAQAGVAPVASIEPARTFQYDYANRLVRYDDDDRAGAGVVTRFAYDALGRRVQKIVDRTAQGGDVSTVNCFYDGDQIIEETDDSLTAPGGGSFGGRTLATYIYGLYVDEPLQMRRLEWNDANANGLRDAGEESFAATPEDIYVIDLSDPSAPSLIQVYEESGAPGGLALCEPYLYAGDKGLTILRDLQGMAGNGWLIW